MTAENNGAKALGTHIILDLYGCSPELLKDVDILKGILREAAVKAQATVMHMAGYKVGGPAEKHPAAKNTPDGVSVYIGLDESHISCHTYADLGMASIDVFTCGHVAKPRIAVGYILSEIRHKKNVVKYIDRFVMEINDG